MWKQAAVIGVAVLVLGGLWGCDDEISKAIGDDAARLIAGSRAGSNGDAVMDQLNQRDRLQIRDPDNCGGDCLGTRTGGNGGAGGTGGGDQARNQLRDGSCSE